MARVYAMLCLSLLALACNVNGRTSDLYTIWSKSYPSTILKPYDWSYLRVELPPRFSSVTISLSTDIEVDPKSTTKRGTYRLPTMCFRQGGPPLPDFSQKSLEEFVLHNVYDQPSQMLQTLNIGKCYAMQGNFTLSLSNEQITEGVLFIGFFYGIGPARTQSRMINRGKYYKFSAFTSVEACNRTNFWGQFCDKILHRLHCIPLKSRNDRPQRNQTIGGREVACRNHLRSCHSPDMSPKAFFLNVKTMSEELMLSVHDIKLEYQSISSSNNNTENDGLISLIVYARNGAIPTNDSFDYSTDISRNKLMVKSPKVGTWYFYIVPDIHVANAGKKTLVKQLCYSLRWKVLGNPIKENDQGSSITKVDGTKFSSIHLPLRKTFQEENFGYPWTYFFTEVPEDVSSRNIRIEIVSNTSIEYELYARLGGLPSVEVYDYYYANQSSNSNNGLSLFKVYVSSNQRVKFDIINAQEGNWSFGLIRRQNSMINSVSQTNLSISRESCPDDCSGYGKCSDISALTSYRCDEFHGGFDCSIEIVPKSEQKIQISFLVGSNAAAIFPAICALWKKSYAEWVIYLSSGVASAIYHACDVQWKCVTKYDTLQFMDFWLSFVAVISTFIYMASISEAMKRAILSVVWILTALMALHDATSSRNINFVIVIGAACLLIAWLVESSTKCTAFSLITTSWFLENLKKICRRYRWGFLVAGFVALALATTSWNLENSENYWFSHSSWHIAMYTAAFFFLCSKVNVQNEGSKPNLNNDMAVIPTTSAADGIIN
ncbi:uncharacterized protein [Spinacia oleracea]|uniref:Uncharacterized protein isoform X2 n=1 Tax=Spinacia oleracea TaxID=3562 RepID=A0ABM3QVI6_SPIOL|nr:uncharacterized protein LOC110784899 isoform X2 [Spinacia oleracea]